MTALLERKNSGSTSAQWLDLGAARVSAASLGDALRHLESAIESRAGQFICFCEANLLSNALRDPRTVRVLERASAVYADGIALLWLARLRGHNLPERIPGPSFILEACRRGVPLGWRHFFLGGAPGVADHLARGLSDRYPGLQIAGTASPPYRRLDASEELELKQQIEASRADVLWVCLGSPKQEQWCAEHLGKIDVPIMLAVGAAFDFHSGTRPWAPAWIRRIGLEWAFRALTGGRRTFVRNVKCVSIVGAYLAKEALSRLVLGRRAGDSSQGSVIGDQWTANRARAGVGVSEPQSHRATEPQESD